MTLPTTLSAMALSRPCWQGQEAEHACLSIIEVSSERGAERWYPKVSGVVPGDVGWGQEAEAVRAPRSPPGVLHQEIRTVPSDDDHAVATTHYVHCSRDVHGAVPG